MFDKLNAVYLIISFCIGIGYIYIITPPPTVVMKFPSPHNTSSLIYKDKSNACYKYKHNKVSCEANNVIDQPVLENFNSNNK
jgi:hypothetical protein